MFRQVFLFVFYFPFLDENRNTRSEDSQERVFLSDFQPFFAKPREIGSNEVVIKVRSLSRQALPIRTSCAQNIILIQGQNSNQSLFMFTCF